jgi:hypothetical protein
MKRIEDAMPDADSDVPEERMLRAALGGLSPHEALVRASLADSEKTEERAEAARRNRERALQLLEILEKSTAGKRSP